MIDRFDKKYTPEEVFKFVLENNGESKKLGKVRAEFDGHMIKPYSLRYLNFIHNGTKCVCCGVEGTHFYKERTLDKNGNPIDGGNNYGHYHFNLYGIDDNGEEVLMTKDHIIARKLGGKDVVDNFQPMCTKCNCEKSHMTIEQWEYYLEHGKYMEGFDRNEFNQPPSPNNKKNKKKRKRKKQNPLNLTLALSLAKLHKKQVFVITTMEGKYCISEDLEHAQRKYKKHIIEPYTGESMEIAVNQRVRINKKEGFELPKVVEVRDREIVVQRRKKKGTLTIPKSRFVKLEKTFRGAEYSYTSSVIV